MSDSKIRAEFEAWCALRPCPLDVYQVDLQGEGLAYLDMETHSAWKAYQAARQSALEEAAKALEPLRETYDSGGDCSAGMGFMDAIEAATAAIRSLANPAERTEGEKT